MSIAERVNAHLPYLRRFYAPSDARSAFIAVKDAAAGMGGHIVAIPRDVLPVLTKKANSIVQNEPESAARLLRSWLAEGER